MVPSIKIPSRYSPDKGAGELLGTFHILGSGKQANVIAAKHADNTRVAIKVYDLTTNQSRGFFKYLRREWKLCRIVSHPQIVEFKEAFYSGDSAPQFFYMVFERMDYTLDTYFDHLKKYDNEPGERKREHKFIAALLVQLLRGVDYIHSLGIIHRDIKPGNIGFNQSKFQIKLFDFGMSRREDKGEDYTANVGSPLYSAPEILAGHRRYNGKVDVWAIAVTVTEMLGVTILTPKVAPARLKREPAVCLLERIFELRGLPDDKHSTEFGSSLSSFSASVGENLADVLPLNRVDHTKGPRNKMNDENLVNLLDKMLSVEPSRRPTAEECLGEPYLQYVNAEYDKLYAAQHNTDEQAMFLSELRAMCKPADD